MTNKQTLFLRKSDGRISAGPRRKRLQCEYDIPVTCCVLTENAPYIHLPNMMNPKMFQIERAYLDIDRIFFQPISSDCQQFRDKQHNASVVPSANTM